MSFPQDAETKGLVESFTRLNALADLMREARSEVPDRITVEDSSGALSLTMRGDGAIEDLQIDSGWRDEIEPEDLGGAITALIGEARTGLYEGANAYIEERADEFEDRVGDAVQMGGPGDAIQAKTDEIMFRSADQGQVLASQAFEDLFDFTARVNLMIDDFESAGADEASGEDEEFPDGEAFVCEESGGLIVRVMINPDWARTTSTATIRRELSEVLTSVEGDAVDDDAGAVLGDAEQLIVDLLGVLRSLS